MKIISLKKFQTLFSDDWKHIPVGVCGWYWGEMREKGLNEYLYGVFGDDEMSGYETYIKLENALKGVNKKLLSKAEVTYRMENGELKYFHLAL